MALTPTDWSHYVTIPESYIPASSTTGQTLVITEATIAKLSAGDQTIFWSNVLNGGGDVRICTDVGGVNQLPVEIVSLDNVGETCDIRTRKATYAGTGDLFLFIGKTGETQPLVNAAFGRNAVWSDFTIVVHGGKTYDSAGNWTQTAAITGTVTTNSNNFEFNRSAGQVDFGSINAAGALDVAVIAVAQMNANPLGNDAIGGTDPHYILADNSDFDSGDVNTFVTAPFNNGTRIASGANTTDTAKHHLVGRWGNGSSSGNPLEGYDSYKDGVKVGENLTPVSGSVPATSFLFTIGGAPAFTTNPINGKVFEFWIADTYISPSYISTSSENLINESAFFGTPTITATAGGGVTAAITESSPAFSDSINTTLTGNRTATISGQLPAFAESVNATLTGVTNTVQITELLPAFTASIAATLTGNATAVITESLPAFTASINATTFPAGVTVALITELSPAFSASISATLTQIRLAEITGQAAAFSDIVNASISGIIESSISESAPAFSASLTATVPGQWTDVVVPGATWTDRTNTPSTWVNIR